MAVFTLIFQNTTQSKHKRIYSYPKMFVAYSHVRMLSQFSIKNHVNSYFVDELGLITHINLVWVYHL